MARGEAPLETGRDDSRAGPVSTQASGLIFGLILGLFLVVELAIILSDDLNRPFADEAHYVNAGLAVLDGEPGAITSPMKWHQGSPFMWAPVSGLFFRLLGPVGPDLAATAFCLVVLVFFRATSRRLFGEQAALWSTALLAANGIFLALAHLAVYDAMACAFASASFWLVVRYADERRAGDLALAGLLLSLSTITKYPYGMTFFPLAALLVALLLEADAPPASVLRAEVLRLAAFALAFGLPTLVYFLVFFGSPLPATFGHYLQIDKGTAFIVGINLAYVLVPGVAGVFGLRLAGRGRLVRLCLLWPLLMWPAIHVATRAYYSSDKHAVIGMLFAYHLAGPVFLRLWQQRHRLTLALLLLLVGVWYTLTLAVRELSVVDMRGPMRFVASEAGEGARVLSFCCHMAADHVARSEARRDLAICENHQPSWSAAEICDFDWVIANPARGGAGDAIEQRIAQAGCGCVERARFESLSLDFTGGPGVFGLYGEQMAVFACERRPLATPAAASRLCAGSSTPVD